MAAVAGRHGREPCGRRPAICWLEMMPKWNSQDWSAAGLLDDPWPGLELLDLAMWSLQPRLKGSASCLSDPPHSIQLGGSVGLHRVLLEGSVIRLEGYASIHLAASGSRAPSHSLRLGGFT